jgi:hypothetical protein
MNPDALREQLRIERNIIKIILTEIRRDLHLKLIYGAYSALSSPHNILSWDTSNNIATNENLIKNLKEIISLLELALINEFNRFINEIFPRLDKIIQSYEKIFDVSFEKEFIRNLIPLDEHSDTEIKNNCEKLKNDIENLKKLRVKVNTKEWINGNVAFKKIKHIYDSLNNLINVYVHEYRI